jgi:mono/diheme cytochrome c family protein
VKKKNKYMKSHLALSFFLVSLMNFQEVLARDSKIDKARYKGAFWGVLANLERLRIECSSVNCGPRAYTFALAVKSEYETIDHRFTGHDLLRVDLDQLLKNIKDGKNSTDILASSFEFERALLGKLDSVPLPAESLSYDLGKNLYIEHCASCHGLRGQGDGLLSNKLKTSLTSFASPLRKQTMTPLSTYAVMVDGARNSEMTSFIEAFSQDEMWNVAFYVSTLPHAETLMPVGDCLDATAHHLDLYQLMSSIDSELEQELAKIKNCKFDVSYLRNVTTFDAKTPRERNGEIAARGSKSARGLVILSVAIMSVCGVFAWVLARRGRVE